MKVHDRATPGILEAYLRQTEKLEARGRKKAEAVSDSQAGMDRVTLSRRARELERLRRALEAASMEREGRIQEIAERIASGKYHVEAREIAEKILERARQRGR